MPFTNLRWSILLLIYSLFALPHISFNSKAAAANNKGGLSGLVGLVRPGARTRPKIVTTTTTTTKKPRKHAILRKVVKVVTTVTEEEEDCRSHGGSPCTTDDQCCLGKCGIPSVGFCPTVTEIQAANRKGPAEKVPSYESQEESQAYLEPYAPIRDPSPPRAQFRTENQDRYFPHSYIYSKYDDEIDRPSYRSVSYK